MESPGKYLYCIIESTGPETLTPAEIDPLWPPLSLVRYRDLACVVSDATHTKYPVSRDYVLPHQHVMEWVMKSRSILPIAFSTVAPAEVDLIARVMQPRYEEFKGLLRWVSDKIELGLKASWKDMAPVFKALIEEREEINTLKVAIVAKSPAATYYDRIEVGKQVQAALQEKREQEANRIRGMCQSHAVDVKTLPLYGDQMVLNAAFLVEREKAPAFHQAVQGLVARSNGNLVFKSFGPVPPCNFISVRISWD